MSNAKTLDEFREALVKELLSKNFTTIKIDKHDKFLSLQTGTVTENCCSYNPPLALYNTVEAVHLVEKLLKADKKCNQGKLK